MTGLSNNPSVDQALSAIASAYARKTELTERLPRGCILIWSGTAANIPSGWALCNGSNGTPDLRDKFVLGAGISHTAGTTGGEETHTLTVEEMPSHNHSVSNYNGAKSGSGSGNNYGFEDVYYGASNVYHKQFHSAISTSGGDQAHNNMPPYYVLCFIMKL